MPFAFNRRASAAINNVADGAISSERAASANGMTRGLHSRIDLPNRAFRVSRSVRTPGSRQIGEISYQITHFAYTPQNVC